jgi:A/G-specific adenine glycosylase
MDRGVSYFLRWIRRFPSIRHVAAASEEEILKYWEGLGYYRRARNLKAAAEKMAALWDGELPQTRKELLELPGVGEYTAGAIGSIAWNRRLPAIDANVERFFARYLDWDLSPKARDFRRALESIILEIMNEHSPREVTQALMEFGALCCTPVRPKCEECPLQDRCLARLRGVVSLRPRQKEKPLPVRRLMAAGVLQDFRGRCLLYHRPEEDLLGGLWEFPQVEIFGKTGKNADEKVDFRGALEEFFRECGCMVTAGEKLCTVRHSFTVNRVLLEVYQCFWAQASPLELPEGFALVSPSRMKELSFHAGGRKILEYLRTREGA